MEIQFDDELLFTSVRVEDKKEVFELLANALAKKGLVDEGYKEAIVEREKVYPTGLPSPAPAVAIPHADYNLVIHTAIAVAILDKPVVFNNMENTTEELEVEIVIMLAIAEPHGQIEMLQRVISFIQDEKLRKEVVQLTDKETILNILNKTLLKG